MRKLALILLAASASACTAKKDASQTDTSATSTTTTATTGTETPIASTETAVAPEVNPPGDIPDSQAFIIYQNRVGGYQLEVPEGWARAVTGGNVSFVSKLDGVSVTIAPASAAPTAASAQANEAKLIQSHKNGKEVTLSVWAPQGADNADQWNRMANSFRWL